MKAIFQRKEPALEPQPCEIENVVSLAGSDFSRFRQSLLENYGFIQERAEDMGIREGIAHCLLVVDESSGDGILVNSEGSGYARYAAWFPGAKAFLQSQGQTVTQTEHQEQVSGKAISPALLDYGRKMSTLIDQAMEEALEHHDQGVYVLSAGGTHDPELFAAMLSERQEVTSAQTDGESIHITLSPESIAAYERSKLRVLSQEDVDIMSAKHTLWTYDAGGERADFSNCLLSGLDLQHRPLNGANFSGALLERTNLSSAGVCFCSFENAKFVDCQMVGISAEEADFRNTSFSGCCARMGHMAHSNFTGAQFENTDLWMADLRNCCVSPESIPEEEAEGINLKGASSDEESWNSEPTLEMQLM